MRKAAYGFSVCFLLFFWLFLCGFSIKISVPETLKFVGGKILNGKADVEACYRDAGKFNESLGLGLGEEIPLHAVSRAEIQREYGKTHKGYTGDVFALYKTKPQESVWIPYGYSYELTMPACAHELTHAWQSRNCPAHQNIILKEGLASWVQSKAYLKVGRGDLARKRMRSNVIREQRMLDYLAKLEREGGAGAVIEFCKANSGLPAEVTR